MNETSEKSNSSLAIVEKKPHKGGGCAGTFFQLFDWNRRFAKKKLFSKKLLPPVRLKQASKKFGGDEKQPKLRLIADENSGGFPNAKNNNVEQKHEMRVPGLVARLMGLDSMPSLHREKSKKFLAPPKSGKTEKLADNNIYEKKELDVEKGGNNNKQESRPQKLQKTSVCESQQITRFRTEKLPFKNVLSKSKKHHPKLPSPLKSPRNLSKKSSSKLIGAATRILEPGLQTSRRKCALTNSNILLHHPPQNNVMEDCDGYSSVAAAMEQSCKNCGYLLGNLDSKSSISEQTSIFASPFYSHCIGSSCQGSEKSKPRRNAFYQELQGNLQEENLQSHIKFTSCNSPVRGQIQRNQNQQTDTFPPRSKFNSLTSTRLSPIAVVNGTKNYVSVNQSKNSGKFESEKRIVNCLKESSPPVRKRRPMNISKQGESSISTMNKQPDYNGHFINNRNEFLNMQERSFDSCEADNNNVPFTFNSSAKRRSGRDEVTERKVRSNFCFQDGLKNSAVGESGRRAKLEKPFPLSGDALGAILEQKLKELNVQGEDNIGGGNAPKKTTATILHELISALTSEIPFQHDNLPALPNRRNSRFYNSLASSTGLQANATTMKPFVDPPFDYEHLSPGSVLEAYYSNESCVSSNLDDNLGCNGSHLPNPESELSEFAASVDTAKKSSKNTVLDILSNVSEILCCNNLASYDLKGDKLDSLKKVLTNAELAFHTAALSSSVIGRGSPIKHLLIDELETLSSILWLNFGSTLGIEDGMEVNQLQRYGLDVIIEYLDQRFDFFSKHGSKLSRKLQPLRMSTNTMMFEIVEGVRKWEELSRFGVDELVEKEMSCSLGEWTEFESEVFESGVEISRDVFKVLVDEIVMDLWHC